MVLWWKKLCDKWTSKGSGTSQIKVNRSSDLESGVEYYILIDSTAFDDSEYVAV